MRSGRTICDVARDVGISARTIRYWEAQGLLPDVERTPAGYRLYGAEHLARLRFIRQAQAIGLSLEDVKDVLALREAGMAPCARVLEMLDERITAVNRLLADLVQVRATLEAVRRRGEQVNARTCTSVCQIIEGQPMPVLGPMDMDEPEPIPDIGSCACGADDGLR